MYTFFAVCAPGLETFTARELDQLGLAGAMTPADEPGLGSGGIGFEGVLRDVYRANLHLRTASRVLVRLGEFYAAAFPELRRKAASLPWERYLAPGQSVALRVTCKKSRLYHSDAVAERIAGAIADRLGRPPLAAKFDEDADADLPQLIVVRLANDRCTISMDSSGALLHRRGYRQATAKAPLRETLAAGMLMASGWDMTSPLLDPFCGSGTIPIEAALMARPVLPGRARRFAFMDWPSFDAALWNESSSESNARGELRLPAILASDRDAGAIQAARANAERAGVGDLIEFACRAVSAIEPPGSPGWVVTNPPYGVRVSSGRDLRNLYAQFGNVLREKCPGWQVAFLCGSLALARHAGIHFENELPLINGGLKVKLLRGRVNG